MNQSSFRKQIVQIALPVALQSLLISSFSIIDQVMVGQVGEAAISGVGIGGRFASIFSFCLSAIISAGGILIAQFIGQKNEKALSRSYYVSQLVSIGLALIFFLICEIMPTTIASLYIRDPEVIEVAGLYLRLYAFSFVPQAFINMYSCLLRCINKASIPTWVTFGSVIVNTFLNACLIFGLFGLPKMGAAGVAIASSISMSIGWLAMMFLFKGACRQKNIHLHWSVKMDEDQRKQYIHITLPLFVTEFIWVLGENVYGMIYGHLGTTGFTAMTMATTIISLVIGALSGFSQAAGILCGKALGVGNFDEAYNTGKKLIQTGLLFACGLSVLTILLSPLYVSIYNVSQDVRTTTIWLLVVFAIYAPVKTTNMINTGGVIRSGGKTKLTLYLDLTGTWLIGVPLGLLGEHLGLNIVYVYALLSLEEVYRMIAGLILFKKRVWMKQLKEA